MDVICLSKSNPPSPPPKPSSSKEPVELKFLVYAIVAPSSGMANGSKPAPLAFIFIRFLSLPRYPPR